jgi:hypothetical protein
MDLGERERERFQGFRMDKTGLGSCSVAAFGISNVDFLGSATIVLYSLGRNCSERILELVGL